MTNANRGPDFNRMARQIDRRTPDGASFLAHLSDDDLELFAASVAVQREMEGVVMSQRKMMAEKGHRERLAQVLEGKRPKPEQQRPVLRPEPVARPRYVVATRLADGTPVIAGETISEGLAAEWQRLFESAVEDAQEEPGFDADWAKELGEAARSHAMLALATRVYEG